MDDHFEIEKLYRELFSGDLSWEEVNMNQMNILQTLDIYL